MIISNWYYSVFFSLLVETFLPPAQVPNQLLLLLKRFAAFDAVTILLDDCEAGLLMTMVIQRLSKASSWDSFNWLLTTLPTPPLFRDFDRGATAFHFDWDGTLVTWLTSLVMTYDPTVATFYFQVEISLSLVLYKFSRVWQSSRITRCLKSLLLCNKIFQVSPTIISSQAEKNNQVV